jgi:hypothetical protein
MHRVHKIKPDTSGIVPGMTIRENATVRTNAPPAQIDRPPHDRIPNHTDPT